ncbi:MAG TPA: beta-galactosidase trimerization domain-containing protein [Terriglobia bacterium]|nr:beta-galactosidase trimerization domain-containing protein [Terriglobia bacterium]
MRRRTFLKETAVGLGTAAGLRLKTTRIQAEPNQMGAAGDRPIITDHYETPDWLRYAQAVYFDGYSAPVSPHIKEFDAQKLLETVKKLDGNALRFQPIGHWAYYPSKAFAVHPELGSRDLIDEVSRECHRSGVHQFCYTGYGHPLPPSWLNDKNPRYADWVLRGPDGRPYGSYGHIGETPPLQRLCTTGDTYRAAIRTVVRELCEHDIEGVYFDAPSSFGYTGICFCDSCRAGFRKFSGMSLEQLAGFVKKHTPNGLPFEWRQIPADADMEALSAWYHWANELTKEDLLDFRKTIHGSGKFMLCHDGAWIGTAIPNQYRVPEGFMVEASEDTFHRLVTGMMGASMVRPYKKLAQMYMGSYALTWFGEPPNEKPWVINETDLEDGDEIRMEGFTNLACGNSPLYAVANRLYYGIGSGSLEPAKEVFNVMKRVEEIHRDSTPVAYLSIVPTWESQQRWQARGSSWNMLMSEGMVLAMLDARISFDVNPSTEMSEEWLRNQRVIALCGASGISDGDAGKLREWVKNGGSLLATYDTGLYDAKGRMRRDGGALKDVLGVEMNGEALGSQLECYYRVRRQHAALGTFAAGALAFGDSRIIPVKTADDTEVIADCWNLATKESRGPAIVVNRYGKGKTVYISGSLEAYYPASQVASVREMLSSIIQYLGGNAPLPFKLKAPRGVYGVLRQASNKDLVLWILGDVGFKSAAAGRMRQDYVSVSEVEVSLQIPEGRQPKGMRLMRAGRSAPFRLEDGYAVATIPSLHIAEVVHLALA